MTTCPFCQIANIPNTVFCTECGYFLLGDSENVTDPLDTNEIGWRGEPADEMQPARYLHFEKKAITVRLKIEISDREFEIPLNRAVELGRSDPSSFIFPEVDLSAEKKHSTTISRRHARITQEKDYVIVEDLGSANGTYLNGQRLAPFLPELLVDGDTLQLGNLLIKVNL